MRLLGLQFRAAAIVSGSVGLLVNVWVAGSLLAQGTHWVLASIVGIVLNSVWNYWITSVFVWKLNQRRRAAD